MSFLGVLSSIGGVALRIAAPVVGLAVPGPLGTLIAGGLAAAQAELDHGDGKGAVKLEQATQATLPAASDSPVPEDQKAAHIKEMISGIVAVLNALAAMFPGAPPKP